MTHFFATPEEAEAWLGDVVERWRLVCHQDVLPGGGRQCFLWPQDLPSLGPVGGVVAQMPEILGQTLTMGVTGWKASAFDEPAASEGRRLNERLSRSLRKLASVPLYAVSFDGSTRSDRPFAWGTPRAADGTYTLRQWRDGAVTFVP